MQNAGKCSIYVQAFARCALDFCGKDVFLPILRHDNKWNHNFGWSYDILDGFLSQ